MAQHLADLRQRRARGQHLGGRACAAADARRSCARPARGGTLSDNLDHPAAGQAACGALHAHEHVPVLRAGRPARAGRRRAPRRRRPAAAAAPPCRPCRAPRARPARQSRSSSRSAATSPARRPRRASRVRIARSRSPFVLRRSQRASSAVTCPVGSPLGSPVRPVGDLRHRHRQIGARSRRRGTRTAAEPATPTPGAAPSWAPTTGQLRQERHVLRGP